MTLNHKLDKAVEMLSYGSLTILTGAGLSLGSGIPVYRGPDGHYTEATMRLASRKGFLESPDDAWDYYESRRELFFDAVPNAGHIALDGLQKLRNATIITQNIDRLHQKAGSTVIDIHGDLFIDRCSECNYRVECLGKSARVCECGARLRPAVVLFDECFDEDAFGRVAHHIESADTILVVGTSLYIPVYRGLISTARMYGANVISVNPEPEARAHVNLTEGADVLPCLFSRVKQNRLLAEQIPLRV